MRSVPNSLHVVKALGFHVFVVINLPVYLLGSNVKLKDSRKMLPDKDSDGRRSRERSDMQREYFSTNLTKQNFPWGGEGREEGGEGWHKTARTKPTKQPTNNNKKKQHLNFKPDCSYCYSQHKQKVTVSFLQHCLLLCFSSFSELIAPSFHLRCRCLR